MIDIKRCIEMFEPEGFRIKYDSVSGKDVLWFNTYCVMFIGDGTPREGLYFLFLQRVRQSLNKTSKLPCRIDQLGTNLYVLSNRDNISDNQAYIDNDEGLEQAINYILGEIK